MASHTQRARFSAFFAMIILMSVLTGASFLAAQQQQSLFITMGGWTYRHDKPGQPAFAAFPGFTGPIATAVSPDGKKFYAAKNDGRLVVLWYPIGENGNIIGPSAGRYKEFGANPGYRGHYTLTANASGVYVSDAPGWGDGNSFRLDANTLEMVEVFQGGSVSGVAVGGVMHPSPLLNKGPFTFGNSKKWLYLAFEDDSIPYTDQEWIAKEVAAQTERWRIPLRVSTGRPPQSMLLTQGRYGTVRIVPPAQWPYPTPGMVGTSGNWRSIEDRGEDKVAWLVGYKEGRGKEWIVWTILHEGIGHSLGALPDLYTGYPGSYGPPGNLMSLPAYSDWRRCLELKSDQIQFIQNGYGLWSSN